MSCYHSDPQYLKESILSILNQSYSDFEFLIADNESGLNLKDFLSRFNDSRIRYIDNGGNIGPAQSYDKLANLAKGEYIAIQDHDDISLPKRLDLEKSALDAFPEIQSVSGGIHIFGCKKERNERPSLTPKEICEELIFWQPIKQPTFMKRRQFCRNYHYNPYWTIYDYEFWSRTRHIPHYILDYILLNYRKSALNSSKERARIIREEHCALIRRNLALLGIVTTFELCQALDPFNHTQCSERCLKEFEMNKNHLLRYISEELYLRKLNEVRKKIAGTSI